MLLCILLAPSYDPALLPLISQAASAMYPGWQCAAIFAETHALDVRDGVMDSAARHAALQKLGFSQIVFPYVQVRVLCLALTQSLPFCIQMAMTFADFCCLSIAQQPQRRRLLWTHAHTPARFRATVILRARCFGPFSTNFALVKPVLLNFIHDV